VLPQGSVLVILQFCFRLMDVSFMQSADCVSDLRARIVLMLVLGTKRWTTSMANRPGERVLPAASASFSSRYKCSQRFVLLTPS
jgi:hypothetical protein